jgi:EAL domain-containing protein (putative c-di-GMP-specific phosphodiesterase class I)/GGDEF domain-containing protein
MSSDSLIQGLPDLIVRLTRDGVVLAIQGGRAVGTLRPTEPCLGQNIDSIWPKAIAMLVKQLARKAIADRTSLDARFQDRGREYQAQVSVQGPDRVLCVLRALSSAAATDADATVERLGPQIDRRGFMRRFKESVAAAALRESSMALAVIQVDGIADIAQAIAPSVSEQVMTAAILRLPHRASSASDADPPWYLGQLSDNLLALVIDSSSRESIEARVEALCASLCEPVSLGSNVFHLSTFAGAALLGQDANSARTLLDHARSAANEARRAGLERVSFFTDTLRVKSLARLDTVHELRDAIAKREIGLRYAGRYDLASGQLTACVAEMVWNHPLRGPLVASEFLGIAESTGLAHSLSQASFQWLQEDYVRLRGAWPANARLSLGVLRHHLAHEEFIADFERALAEGAIPPQQLELRISEKHLGTRAPGEFKSLADRGVELLVEDVGGAGASLAWLARAPVAALQIDIAWSGAIRTDASALKICRAAVGLARSFRMHAIAAGVDDPQQCKALLDIGFDQGVGQLFPALALSATPAHPEGAARFDTLVI